MFTSFIFLGKKVNGEGIDTRPALYPQITWDHLDSAFNQVSLSKLRNLSIYDRDVCLQHPGRQAHTLAGVELLSINKFI